MCADSQGIYPVLQLHIGKSAQSKIDVIEQENVKSPVLCSFYGVLDNGCFHGLIDVRAVKGIFPVVRPDDDGVQLICGHSVHQRLGFCGQLLGGSLRTVLIGDAVINSGSNADTSHIVGQRKCGSILGLNEFL